MNDRLPQTPLAKLEGHDEFVARHIGPSDDEVDGMLAAIGQQSLDSMVEAIVPASIRLGAPLALPAAINEPTRWRG